MIILYPSNIASINALFNFYKRYKVNIMNNNNEIFVTRDPSGITEFCQIPTLPSTNINFDDPVYIISTRIISDNSECTSPTIEIVLDIDKEYAWHHHTILCYDNSIGYFYHFYRNKGIRCINIYTNVPNRNGEPDHILFNIDLTKDNIDDAISVSDFARFISTNNETINRIIANKAGDDWYNKVTCYVNAFKIEQFINIDGTMDESIKINVDNIGWYE